MAAGQGYIEFTTGDVLTAAAANGYLASQVVMVFASSAARTSAIASPQEGMLSYLKDTNAVEAYDGAAWISVGSTGDITGVTAGTGISGGGTSGTVTVTNSMATAIDAKGDLIAGTGADAFSRLAVGANGTILTADSAEATGIKWAAAASGGGMTSLASGSFSGATVSLTSISGSYNSLRLVAYNWAPASANNNLLMRFNSDTGTSYVSEVAYTLAADSNANATSIRLTGGTATSSNGLFVVEIPFYASTAAYKYASVGGLTTPGSGGTATRSAFINGFWNSTSAITSIQLIASSGNHGAGTYVLYGVK